MLFSYNVKQRLYNLKLYIYNRKCRIRKGGGRGIFAMKHPAQWTILYIIGFFRKNPCIMDKDGLLYVRCASAACVQKRKQ